ncbi:MAG: YadA C-terminal domain-containing protein [Neisseria zoodegmatis]|uniref:YadA C-terminal domain-containing protein n=1 Tax=Neisseria zoodegmatis TaxID=326523 RepID=UPI0026E99902|nr:YadA C-terminal domain-containing protein [Neisseria zoodegmatis]MDO5069933.1 YadA C-terminal domain-containing protein [Neisseria zoodegmatis]
MKIQKTAFLASVTAAALGIFAAGNVYADDQLSAKVANNSERISNNLAVINSQANLIGEAQRNIKTNQNNIASNLNAIQEQSKQIFDTGRYARENRELINANTKVINTNKTEIERISKVVDPKLAERVANNTQRINANVAVLNTQAGLIGTVNSRSQTNQNNIASNLNAINANKAAIERIGTQNAAKLKQIEHKVNNIDKEVKRGLASQAALAGLFQPYNVGKLNVSAAVGGYQSETAVAIGSGYRFNDHFAAKAGVSLNTKGGDASYNVGFNFEW